VERLPDEFACGDCQLGCSVSHPAFDLTERGFELLAEEVDATRDGIDDVAFRADLGARAEVERGVLLDDVYDVSQPLLDTLQLHVFSLWGLSRGSR
jgi:hypothetical protein